MANERVAYYSLKVRDEDLMAIDAKQSSGVWLEISLVGLCLAVLIVR